jgi:hypothetical protein
MLLAAEGFVQYAGENPSESITDNGQTDPEN